VDEIVTMIKDCEQEIEQALVSHEQAEQLDEALEAYRKAEEKLTKLALDPEHPAYKEQQRVLAYCWMRQANILRQLGQIQQASLLSQKEIEAARASGDDLTLARSAMSFGLASILNGNNEEGISYLDEARNLFERKSSYDYQQGLGWYWILQADLINHGLLFDSQDQAVEAASQALALLQPLENWPGIVRAYGARAEAYEKLNRLDEARADREAQARSEQKVNPSSD
jgi:tetratricopeptide (TPR) repeat protein